MDLQFTAAADDGFTALRVLSHYQHYHISKTKDLHVEQEQVQSAHFPPKHDIVWGDLIAILN